MSFHVYIARDGWAETPITQAEFVEAARSHPDLDVREHARYVAVSLRGHRSERLHATQGWVHAQAPSEALVRVMFDLAALLDARVWSERAKPYRDLDDWRGRTADFRARQAQAQAEAQRRRWRSRALFVILVALVVAAAFGLEFWASR